MLRELKYPVKIYQSNLIDISNLIYPNMICKETTETNDLPTDTVVQQISMEIQMSPTR